VFSGLPFIAAPVFTSDSSAALTTLFGRIVGAGL